MSLKNVSLDPFLLAQLYKTHLIPMEKTGFSKDEPADISFLGNNRRNITLLIHNEKQPWLPDEIFSFLTKILEACQLSMDDVALVNEAGFPALALSDIKEQLSPDTLILFGDAFKNWSNTELLKNQINRIDDISCLWSDDLEKIQSDAQLKKTFWQALQQLFNLKK